MRRITKTAVWFGLGGALYFIASNHFIYLGGWNVKLLKKKEITLSHTFFSTSLKTNQMILSNDTLREAGIAELLIKAGLLSKEEKERIMAKYEADE